MNLLKTSRLLLFTVAAAALAQSAYAQTRAHALMPGPAAAGHMRSHAWVSNSPALAHGPGQSNANCLSGGCYYLPSDFVTAYATGSIPLANGGAGVTVAIVDAYYNPQTLADCDAFSAFAPIINLPACDTLLTIVNQTGGSPSGVGFNAGWALETDLDVQTVHSIAPNAKILLVVCNSDSDSDLGAGDEYAEAHADVVSNSFGEDEFAGELGYNTYLSGSTVPVLFSSGDNGDVSSPCISKYALCVGGTRLLTNESAAPADLTIRNVESAWGGINGDGACGGGCSVYIAEPGFQDGYSTCGSWRGVPDISALADPDTGVTIYLGTNQEGTPGLYCCIGGTSLASPLTAAVIALIDADREANGKTRLGANLNALIYASAASYHYRFYDVTTGTNTCVGGASAGCSSGGGNAAGAGWDQATGLGVILGPGLATYLLTTP